MYAASVLDITSETILTAFRGGVQNVAAMSRALSIPTAASAPHCLLEAFKHCAALGLECDFVFKQMEALKQAVENPSAFVAAAPAGAAAASAAAAPEAKQEEEEEEEDGDMGLGLFD